MIVRLAAVMLMLIALPAIAQEPIRIGFLTILTGPLAAPGKEMENGITLFLDEQKQTLGGRPVQLTVLDSGGTPAGTLAKARELVEQRKVHVIIGPLAAFEAYAIAPYVNAQRSEEHTSELQSHSELVCRLLLEKKKADGLPSGLKLEGATIPAGGEGTLVAIAA